MKRGCGKFETCKRIPRIRSVQILALIGLLYMIFMTFEVPLVIMTVLQEKEALIQFSKEMRVSVSSDPSGLILDWRALINTEKDEFSGLNKSAITAFELGEKLWEDLKSGKMKLDVEKEEENRKKTPCPNSVLVTGAPYMEKGKVMELPCGLRVGSNITVVAKPRLGFKNGDQSVIVSQFIFELIGLNTVDGEDEDEDNEEEAPKILHYNPRLKGDNSGKPVIEQNTRFRQQWGTSIRCQGLKSKPDEETGEFFNPFFHLI